MTLGEIKAQVVGLLNRGDFKNSSSLQTTFLRQGLARIQRVLRVPSMERTHYITENDEPIQTFQVPNDLLQIMDLYVNGVPIQKKALRQLMLERSRCGDIVDQPRMYARVGASIFLYPTMPPNSEMILAYYGEFSPLVDDSSENEVTTALPDLLTYAALAFAGGYFKMDQAAMWEQTYEGLLAEVQGSSDDLEMTGGGLAVEPAFGDY